MKAKNDGITAREDAKKRIRKQQDSVLGNSEWKNLPIKRTKLKIINVFGSQKLKSPWSIRTNERAK